MLVMPFAPWYYTQQKSWALVSVPLWSSNLSTDRWLLDPATSSQKVKKEAGTAMGQRRKCVAHLPLRPSERSLRAL